MNVQLIKDISPGAASSSPRWGENHAGEILFSATGDGHGRELWTSDGTPSGTRLVKDIESGNRGSFPTKLRSVGDFLIFSAATTDKGSEPWVTNGARDGTHLLRDLNPGVDGSYPRHFTRVGNAAYFLGVTNSDLRLWKTSGERSTTRSIDVIGANPPEELTSFDGRLFYFIERHSSVDLWKVGPDEVPRLVKSVSSQYGLKDVAVTQESLFFISDSDEGGALWRSDGTRAGTQLVTGDNGLIAPGQLMPAGQTLFMTAYRPGSGRELFWVNPQTGEAALVKDINPGDGTSFIDPGAGKDGVIFFTASDGSHGSELWRSDGTFEGTTMVRDIADGSTSSGPYRIRSFGDQVLFSLFHDESGGEPWMSDGTFDGTRQVGDIYPGQEGSTPLWLDTTGDMVVFSAFRPTDGRELWVLLPKS